MFEGVDHREKIHHVVQPLGERAKKPQINLNENALFRVQMQMDKPKKAKVPLLPPSLPLLSFLTPSRSSASPSSP